MTFKEKIALFQQLKNLSSSFKQQEEQDALNKQQEAERQYNMSGYGQLYSQNQLQNYPNQEVFSQLPTSKQGSLYRNLISDIEEKDTLKKTTEADKADFEYYVNRAKSINPNLIVDPSIDTPREAQNLYNELVSQKQYELSQKEKEAKEVKLAQEKAKTEQDIKTKELNESIKKTANVASIRDSIVSDIDSKITVLKGKGKDETTESFKTRVENFDKVAKLKNKLKNNEQITGGELDSLLMALGYLKEDKSGNLSPDYRGTALIKQIENYNANIDPLGLNKYLK